MRSKQSIILIIFIGVSGLVQAQSNAAPWQFGLHVGGGYQTALRWGSNVELASFPNYLLVQDTYQIGYAEVGLSFSNGKTEFGVTPRIGFTFSNRPDAPIKLLPALWASQYFGGQDGMLFKVGLNAMLITLKNEALIINPAGGGSKPSLPAKSTYLAIGPTVGIRLAQSGFLKNWYAQAQWQLAAPSGFDDVAFTKATVRQIWSVGVTKQIRFGGEK